MSQDADRRVIDVRAFDGSGEVVAYANGGLFPVLAIAPNGVAVAVLRGGAGHLGLDGRIDVVRSRDAGASWSPPSVVADSDRDDRNPALGVAADGALVLAYQRQGSYDEAGTFRRIPRGSGATHPIEIMVTRSVDAGLTWATPAPLSDESLRTGSPFGKIVADAEGTLFMAVYVYDGTSTAMDGSLALGSHLLRSRDGGATWGDSSLIAPGMNETALLVLPDGTMLAMLRSNDKDAAIWCARSDDGGRRWSTPLRVTGARQQGADAILLASGDVLLTYGNRNPPYRVEGRISRDGGRSWSDDLVTFSGHLYGYNVTAPRPTDLGYPSSIVSRVDGTGRGVTMYYYNPSLGGTTHQGRTIDEARYQAKNYCAIAVTWSEEELIRAIAR